MPGALGCLARHYTALIVCVESGAKATTKAEPEPTKVAKPPEVDHGTTPQWVHDHAKAVEDTLKDPWGFTPAQMRTS